MRVPNVRALVALVVTACACFVIRTEFFPPRPPESGTSPLASGLERAEALAALGPDGVAELAAELAGADVKVRCNSLYGLARIGPDAREALPEVRVCLSDTSSHVRVYAISAIRCISPSAEAAASIAPLISDGDSEVARAAANALQAIGASASQSVLPLLRDDRASVRTRAIRLLRAIYPDACDDDVAEAAGWLVDDPDPEARLTALAARVAWGVGSHAEIRALLSSNGPFTDATGYGGRDAVEIALDAIVQAEEPAELFPDLMPLIEDPATLADRRLTKLLAALSSMGQAARPAIPRLLRILTEVDQSSQLAIARTVWVIGAEPDVVSRLIVPLIAAGDANPVSWGAGGLLVQVSPADARQEAHRLLELVFRADGSVDRDALYALWALAPESRDAVPVLGRLLGDKNPRVFDLAASALAAMAEDAAGAVPSLAGALRAPGADDRRRALAARALAKIGPAAASAVPALIAILNAPARPLLDGAYPAESLRVDALDALAAIGDSDDAVVSSVNAQLASTSPRVRVAAIRALVHLVPDSTQGANQVVECLHDDNPAVRGIAALAAADLRGERSQAIEALAEALEDENPCVRTAAAMTLGRLGPQARSALPALRKAAQDESAEQTNARFWQSSSRGQRPQWAYMLSDLDDLSVAAEARAAIAKIDARHDECVPAPFPERDPVRGRSH